MKSEKTLLIGSSPILVQQIKKINLSDYKHVCVINNIFNLETNRLFLEHSISPDYYYFSDFTYYDRGYKEKIDAVEIKRKIMCIPSQKKIPRDKLEDLSRKGIEVCDVKIINTINYLGNYSLNTWASTGMFSLGHLIMSENHQSIDLAGFSFFSGKLHYYDEETVDKSRHNTNSEKNIYKYFNNKKFCRLL